MHIEKRDGHTVKLWLAASFTCLVYTQSLYIIFIYVYIYIYVCIIYIYIYIYVARQRDRIYEQRRREKKRMRCASGILSGGASDCSV